LPLLLAEPFSARAAALLEEDSGLVIWWGTPLECWSGIHRRVRDGSLAVSELASLARQLSTLVELAVEIEPGLPLRERAADLLAVHPLRAADALQLAAALIAEENLGAGFEFVSLDQRLREAAGREGLAVIPVQL
jgi:predicted nucleic acid-binding protein